MPVHGDTKARFTASLAKMLMATLRARPEIEIEFFITESSTAAANRAHLVRRAEAWRADYVLWLDVDHTFPPDTLLRLLAWERPVVGVNYPRRANPMSPVAERRAGDRLEPVFTTKALAAVNSLEQVATLGLGVCLMRLSALTGLEQPLFDIEMDGHRLSRGEDQYLFRKLEAAGTPVFVDHALSWEVGHIGEFIATNAMTEGNAHADTVLPSAGAQ